MHAITFINKSESVRVSVCLCVRLHTCDKWNTVSTDFTKLFQWEHALEKYVVFFIGYY